VDRNKIKKYGIASEKQTLRPNDTIAMCDGSTQDGRTGCGIKISFPDGSVFSKACPIFTNSCSYFGEVGGLLKIAEKLYEPLEIKFQVELL